MNDADKDLDRLEFPLAGERDEKVIVRIIGDYLEIEDKGKRLEFSRDEAIQIGELIKRLPQ